MKRVWMIAALVVLALAACGRDEERVTPSLKQPMRIVSLVPSLTDAVIFHGKEARLVGASRFCVPAIEKWDTVAIIGDALTPDIEAIAALKPDLVLTHDWQDDRPRKELERLNIPLFILPDPKTLDDISRNIEAVGTVLGDSMEAKRRVEEWRSAIRSELDAGPDSSSRRMRTYIEVHTPGHWTIGGASYLNTIMTGLGLDNIFGSEDFSYKDVTDESIIEKNPELVILFYRPEYGTLNGPALSATIAGRRGALIAFEGWREITIPGPRLLHAIRALKAGLSHVER